MVVDDSAVKDSEQSKRSKAKNLIILGSGLLLGVIVGFMVGNTTGDRKLWKLVVGDAKAIYGTVNEVSKVVDEAKGHVQQVVNASRGGPGKTAKIDYGSIEKLVALKKPLTANAFHRRRYKAFQAGTVDDLFDYYNNVTVLWEEFTTLGATTAGTARREALNKSTAAADEVLNSQYGLVPVSVGEVIAGGLVFVTIPPPQKDEKGEIIASLNVNVATRPGGKQVERERFVGQPEFVEDPTKYVILIDKARSMNVVGQRASAFMEFKRSITKIDLIMNKTIEVQGRLIKTLGDVAAKY